MSKKVRIENADASQHNKLMVERWRKGINGAPDALMSEIPLDNPSDLAEVWVWDEQYFVVREKPAGKKLPDVQPVRLVA